MTTLSINSITQKDVENLSLQDQVNVDNTSNHVKEHAKRKKRFLILHTMLEQHFLNNQVTKVLK